MSELRLITIPLSHYCEKARWALERARLPFVEEGHVPLLDKLARRDRGSVPVLLTPDGKLPDSTDILRWVDRRAGLGLYAPPGAAELEDLFDEKLGPATRRIAYFHLMQQKDLLCDLLGQGVPRGEALAFRGLYPLVVGLMRRAMKIDAAGEARSRQRLDQVFATVADRLADGRRYLCGDAFSAADLTFAALAAPVLGIPEYGVPLPPPSALPPALARDIERLRATPAGRFAQRVYREDRR